MLASLRANDVQLFVSSCLSFRRADPNRQLLSSNCLEAFRFNYRRFVLQRKCDLEKLLRESDLRLHPFADPLSCDLSMSFVLANAREESYSAVLEWLVHRLPAREVTQVFGLGDTGTDQSKDWETVREYQVRDGDEIGRLDLVLRRNRQCLVVIEVKTKPYIEEELRKHKLYCAAVRKEPAMREAEKIFLAQRDEGLDLGGFRFRSWWQVCLGLRQSCRSIIESRPYGEAALFLALLGAIEQNLLSLNRKTNAPAVVRYLEEILEGETVAN
jgi:Holliday junction resolvase-like predicted endonuclease